MKTHDVKKINRGPFVALGIGVVALASGLGWQAANGGPTKTEAASSTTAPASSGMSSTYQPTGFPNVFARHVPKAHTSKSSAGSIYVKPGAKWSPERAAAAQRSVSRGVINREEPGRSAAGGTVLYLDQSQLPLEVAHRDAKGKVTWKCDQDSHPHSLAEHQAHQAKSAKGSAANTLRSNDAR